ncbi:phage head closure protein [Oxalobacteraceae sp. CFBP 8753]|nr:phage head closure protein [Oxalobacteraceae sp. CFBP 8753]
MMNDRITLRRSAGKDKIGQPIDAPVDVATVWADVLFQSGAEVMRAGADTAIVKCSIRIRARPDVDTGVSVLFKSKVYDVKSAPPDNSDRRFMFLICESTS